MQSQSGVVSVKRVHVKQALAIQRINWNRAVSEHLFLVTELRAIAERREKGKLTNFFSIEIKKYPFTVP